MNSETSETEEKKECSFCNGPLKICDECNHRKDNQKCKESQAYEEIGDLPGCWYCKGYEFLKCEREEKIKNETRCAYLAIDGHCSHARYEFIKFKQCDQNTPFVFFEDCKLYKPSTIFKSEAPEP